MIPFTQWSEAMIFVTSVNGDVTILLEVLGGIGIYCYHYRPDKPIKRGSFIGVYRRGPARPFAPWQE